MKTKIHSQSGIFNPRILAAFALGSVGVLLAMLSFAAAPASSMPLAPTGPRWSIVTSPNTSPTDSNFLSDVTCASASDCWAVGSYNIGGVGWQHRRPLYRQQPLPPRPGAHPALDRDSVVHRQLAQHQRHAGQPTL